MSRAISAGFNTHLQGTTTTIALCMDITRDDGSAFYFTEHDVDLEIDGQTYQSAASFTASNVRTRSGTTPDTMSITGLIDSTAISEADLRAGLFDGADTRIFAVNWSDLSQGKVWLKRGRIGDTEISERGYSMQLRDMSMMFQTTVGDLIGPSCIVDLFSIKCGVQKASTWAATTAYTVRPARDASIGSVVKPTVEAGLWFRATVAGTSGGSEPTWPTTIGGTVVDGGVTWLAFRAFEVSGTVTGVTSRRQFSDSSLDQPDNWFDGGVVTFTSGLNNGLSMDVEVFGGDLGSPSAGQVRLLTSMPFDIAAADTFTLARGCQKDLAACRDIFDNIENMRATGLYLPGLESIISYPDAQ